MGSSSSPALYNALATGMAPTEEGTRYLDDYLPGNLSPRDHWTGSP
jgi:hypothetical protein